MDFGSSHVRPNPPRALPLERTAVAKARAMLQWLSGNERDLVSETFASVTEGLQALYREKLLPIERAHLFQQFYSPELTDADFASGPSPRRTSSSVFFTGTPTR